MPGDGGLDLPALEIGDELAGNGETGLEVIELLFEPHRRLGGVLGSSLKRRQPILQRGDLAGLRRLDQTPDLGGEPPLQAGRGACAVPASHQAAPSPLDSWVADASRGIIASTGNREGSATSDPSSRR